MEEAVRNQANELRQLQEVNDQLSKKNVELSDENDQLSGQNKELSKVIEEKSDRQEKTTGNNLLAMVGIGIGSVYTILFIYLFLLANKQVDRWEMYDNEMAILKQYKNETNNLELTDLNCFDHKFNHLKNLYTQGQDMINSFRQTFKKISSKAEDLEKMHQIQNMKIFELMSLYELKRQVYESILSASSALKDLEISRNIEAIVSYGHETHEKFKNTYNTLWNYSPDMHQCNSVICFFDLFFFNQEIRGITKQFIALDERRVQTYREFQNLLEPENTYYREKDRMYENYYKLRDKIDKQVELAPICFQFEMLSMTLNWIINMRAIGEDLWVAVYNDNTLSFHINEPDETIFIKTASRLDLVVPGIPIYLLKKDVML